VALPILSDPHSVPIVVLYAGPDQIMPLASTLGAVVGLALMLWNRVAGVAQKCRTFVVRRNDAGLEPQGR
jgi:hypothetical protein